MIMCIDPLLMTKFNLRFQRCHRLRSTRGDLCLVPWPEREDSWDFAGLAPLTVLLMCSSPGVLERNPRQELNLMTAQSKWQFALSFDWNDMTSWDSPCRFDAHDFGRHILLADLQKPGFACLMATVQAHFTVYAAMFLFSALANPPQMWAGLFWNQDKRRRFRWSPLFRAIQAVSRFSSCPPSRWRFNSFDIQTMEQSQPLRSETWCAPSRHFEISFQQILFLIAKGEACEISKPGSTICNEQEASHFHARCQTWSAQGTHCLNHVTFDLWICTTLVGK